MDSDIAASENADKMHDPQGGLSAEGRRKFNKEGSNLKPGVTGYNGASTADKKRWVRWALRFTKTARPLTKPNGDPTPYAKMFQAWGRPIPKNAADVRATHNLALTRKKALGMGDSASEIDSLGYDQAHLIGELFPCPEPGCLRDFVSIDSAFDHAEAVHTFNDIRNLVNAALSEKYAVRSASGNSWVYVEDLAEDWVVYVVEGNGGMTLQKVSYTIANDTVTLGDPVDVRRRTVYEEVR